MCVMSSLRFLPATREMWCYNAVIADARVPATSDIQGRCSILSPELALPSGPQATTTRSHGALHILGMYQRTHINSLSTPLAIQKVQC